MSSRWIAPTYVLIACCCVLVDSALAISAGSTAPTDPARPFADAGSDGIGSRRSLYDDRHAVATSLQKASQADVESMNQLGIRYARGRGVAKNYAIAMKWFRRSALEGYAPAMANLGTLYQMGEGRRRNYRRAYAWLRAALALGVPEEDHDATVFKLGMIASHLSPTNVARAERLAEDLAESVTQQCNVSAERYTSWAYAGGHR